MKTALVLGCSGLIGSHMVDRLKSEGYWVRGVDIKHPDYHVDKCDEFLIYDLRDPRNVEAVLRLDVDNTFSFQKRAFVDQKPFDEVYQFAADMGGAGYIFTGEHDADIMTNSALINLNVAAWAKIYEVGKLFYSSSACVYSKEFQNRDSNAFYLSEWMAYPANPDSEYGWEKLFSERLYLAYHNNYRMNVRIARFHNIYGERTPYLDPKAKAPAAICRKVAESKQMTLSKSSPYFSVDIWGDGKQTRSFLYIDDCIDAVRLLMQSDFTGPVNIGSEEMISINDLAKMVIGISGKDIHIKNIPGPVGVRGRNSDNTLIREKLGWEPKYSLREGMEKLYSWVNSQVNENTKGHSTRYDHIDTASSNYNPDHN